MNTLLNPKTAEFIETLQSGNDLVTHDLNLMAVLSAATLEKEKEFFAGLNMVIAHDVNEAKEIILLNKESSFDAIICDSEISRKNIVEFIGFLNSNKITRHTPVLLFVLQDQSDRKLQLNHFEGIDDIICSDIPATELNEKIEILKKYKFFQDKLPYYTEPPKYELPNYQCFLKRALDIILSSLLIILSSPLMLVIAIAIKLESKGPVFYRSLRAGRWYKVFTFFKFRTMVVNADSMVAELQYMNEYKDFQTSFFFKLKDDPRVTRIGKFLRKTSLDELPQLFNVLKGDMSLVGNRPLPLYEAQTITVDKSAKRFFASAGITGLWQVTGRSNDNLTINERIAMDIDYADNSSFLYDLKILFKTPKELILKSNV